MAEAEATSIETRERGFTPRSVAASIFCLLALSVSTQYAEVVVGLAYPAEHTLAAPAVIIFVLLLALCGMFYSVWKFQLLNRSELLCIFYAMLLAAPLITQGFWHRVVSITATIPHQADFEKMDALGDRIWPHGPNLLANALAEKRLQTHGDVTWQRIEFEQGRFADLPVLHNSNPGDFASVKFEIPIERDGKSFLIRNEMHMISVLLRPNMNPDSYCFCRIYNDDEPDFASEILHQNLASKVTFAHQTGFARLGTFRAMFSPTIKTHAMVEFGLAGIGELALTDPKLMNVSALEGAFTAQKIVRESEFNELPVQERANLIVKPDNMWSWSGVKFVLAGYVPVAAWAVPILTWGAFVALIMAALFAVNVIMRKQWIDSERYPLPIARVPLALLGYQDSESVSLSTIWRNRLMWIGFAASLFWCMMKGWSFYNPKVPNMDVSIAIKPYLSDPAWGGMWDINFKVCAIFVSLAIFMELNVLLSLVVGYFAARSLHWIGEFTGLQVYPGYPFEYQQQIGAFLAYGLVVLFFTRKYLAWVIKDACGANNKAINEAMTYRGALLLIVAAFAGIAIWAEWVGVSTGGMIAFFLFTLLIGFVSSKIRAECGTPFGYFAPAQAVLVLPLLGGVKVFGVEFVLMCFIISYFLCPTVFFLMPGAQLETMELGRRFRTAPRDIAYTCILGLLGGLLIGGWAFLSNAYSIGGDKVKYAWAFNDKPWYFFEYNREVSAATADLVSGKASVSGFSATTWAYVFAGVVTVILTVLRQLFSGFWFHPIGFVLGTSHMMNDYIWGSVLVAWAIRFVVLKLGGASTIRTKLQPIFIGVFLGAMTSYLFWAVYASYLTARGVTRIYGGEI